MLKQNDPDEVDDKQDQMQRLVEQERDHWESETSLNGGETSEIAVFQPPSLKSRIRSPPLASQVSIASVPWYLMICLS